MDDFLKTEYEQCFSLINHYDERHQSLVKYASGLSGAIPSLLLAIYQLNGNAAQYFWEFTFVISLVATFGLLSIFTVLIQTRLYFIYPVRQVNSIRKFCLENLQNENFSNQMYLSTSFNAFKWTSSHTLLNFFVSIQVGIFAGLTSYTYMLLGYPQQCTVKSSVAIGFIFSILLFTISSIYLHLNSKYHPDKSIHKER